MSSVRGGNQIVKDGLVFYLDAPNNRSFVVGSTNWVDLTGNNKPTNLTSTTFSNSYIGGIQFNGTNSFGSSSVVNTYSETIMVWVKSNTPTWNDLGWISSSRTPNGHIIHPEGSSNQVSFYVLNSSSDYTLMGTVNMSNIMIPHCYCLSTNGSNSHKIHIDGLPSSTNNTSITRTSSTTSRSWYIGLDLNSRFGNGVIYSVMKYNRQLSDSEILQNYNALKNRFVS